jgi:hypothetical protein
MKMVLLLWMAVLSVVSCSKKKSNGANSGTVGYHPMAWLGGKWATVVPFANSATEEWTIKNDSVMLGVSYTQKQGAKPQLFETISLTRRSNKYYYTVKGVGADSLPIDFTIIQFSDSAFIAENAQHDFPKRIVYKLINKDSIAAFVDDALPNSNNKIDFNYKRVQ